MSGRVLAIVTSILLGFGSAILLSSNATAATKPALPDGWKMYAVDCEYNDNGGQVYEIDPATGNATAIGDKGINDDSDCAFTGTYDPIRGLSVIYNYDDWEEVETFATVDVATGVITSFEQDTSDWEGAVTARSDGSLYGYLEIGDHLELHKIAPNGTQTRVGTHEFLDGSTLGRVLAFNPKDGFIYGVMEDTESNPGTTEWEFIKIDPDTGIVTNTGINIDQTATGTNDSVRPYGMGIDSNGIAWLVNRDAPLGRGLMAVDLQTGDSWIMSDGFYNPTLYPYDEHSFYVNAVWLVPGEDGDDDSGENGESEDGETLPETGASFPAGLLVAGLMAVALGAVAIRRRNEIS